MNFDTTYATLMEATKPEPLYKNVFSEDGKKIEGKRSVKYVLGFGSPDGSVTTTIWKEWSKSDLPDKSTKRVQDDVIRGLVAQLKFNVQMDFAEFSKKNKNWEKQVDWLIEAGAKFPKTGLTTKQ
jgi:hypothetical protein